MLNFFFVQSQYFIIAKVSPISFSVGNVIFWEKMLVMQVCVWIIRARDIDFVL